MHTYFINATQFMIMETIFLEYGCIGKRQLGEVLGINITGDVIAIREHYDTTRCWTFDFENQVATSPEGKIYWNSIPSLEAWLRFSAKTGDNVAYHDHRLKSVKNQGGYIDCDTLKTVWPRRDGEDGWLLFGNGLAMAN